MSKLFDSTVPGQHIRITVDLMPPEPLSRDEVNKLIETISDNLDHYYPATLYGFHHSGHKLQTCEADTCVHIAEIVALADEHYHKMNKTEHQHG